MKKLTLERVAPIDCASVSYDTVGSIEEQLGIGP
jgi:hypothetical protein